MVVIKSYIKSVFSVICLLILAVSASIFLQNKNYMLISIVAAFISCIPFFISFEKNINSSRETVTIAVMIALSVAGRFIFTLIPHFKPVTALVIITGMYFGPDAGFMTGSLTALLSNMQHGQGPWTVFQMAVWGLIGFSAGLLNIKGLLKNKLMLLLFSAVSGIAYSLIMDIYTTISTDSTFIIEKYLTYVVFSMPVMIEYVISNIIFMLILEKPIGKKLLRVKTKYGVFQ